jgi:hypothetical protein
MKTKQKELQPAVSGAKRNLSKAAQKTHVLRGIVLDDASKNKAGLIQIEGSGDIRLPYLNEHAASRLRPGDTVEISISITQLQAQKDRVLFKSDGRPFHFFYVMSGPMPTKKGVVSNVRPQAPGATGVVGDVTADGIPYLVADPTGRMRNNDNVEILPDEGTRGPMPTASLIRNCGATPCV